MTCVTNSILRFGYLSIITPANNEKSVIVKNRIVSNKPSRNGESVIENTSYARPMFCIHVPIKKTHWPSIVTFKMSVNQLKTAGFFYFL